MRLWEITTIMKQVFRVAARNDIEALEIFHEAFPVEKEIRGLKDAGYLYVRDTA